MDKWQRELEWNTIYLENHDQPRSVSRFGSNKYPTSSAKLLSTLLLTLKGTPFIFEGEEIGMTNFDFTSMEEIEDVESKNIYKILSSLKLPKRIKWKMIKNTSRDNARTPMQWNEEDGAGFTSGKPWLGINKNKDRINVREEEMDKESVLSYYRRLISFRKKSEDLLSGDYKLIENSKYVTEYKRGGLYIILNHSNREVRREIKGEILLSSEKERKSGILKPWEAIIMRRKYE